MEHRIKEQQLDLFADRTSCHRMRANQLRLWLSAAAYVLVSELRRMGLASTIRLALLKIGAQVSVNVRRVAVRLSSTYSYVRRSSRPC